MVASKPQNSICQKETLSMCFHSFGINPSSVSAMWSRSLIIQMGCVASRERVEAGIINNGGIVLQHILAVHFGAFMYGLVLLPTRATRRWSHEPSKKSVNAEDIRAVFTQIHV